SATATVTVVAASIATFVVLPAAPTVLQGSTQQLMAIAGPTGASSAATWAVQEGAVCGTVTAGGLYTAPTSAPVGGCHVVATSLVDSSQSAIATVTICSGGSGCAAAQFDAVWGGARSCITRRTDGSVWVWGTNGFGKLGDGTFTERDTAVQMHGAGGF